ncbi:MAG: hypothetical protein WCO98_09630 [bacterium]
MKITIGVMGSVSGFNDKAGELSHQLGHAIANNDCIIITGACPGLPHDAVCGAREAGGMTVGVSPGHNLAEHTIKYNSPWQEYDVIVYTGSGLMGREITGVRSCDIVVLVGGRSGTLGEFAIAYDEGKLIGVLQGTGGIAEHVSTLVDVMHKDTGAMIIYDSDPHKLVEKLLNVYRQRGGILNGLEVSQEKTPEMQQAEDTAVALEMSISDMVDEVEMLQSRIAEQKIRLVAVKDLAVMGSPERG